MGFLVSSDHREDAERYMRCGLTHQLPKRLPSKTTESSHRCREVDCWLRVGRKNVLFPNSGSNGKTVQFSACRLFNMYHYRARSYTLSEANFRQGKNISYSGKEPVEKSTHATSCFSPATYLSRVFFLLSCCHYEVKNKC